MDVRDEFIPEETFAACLDHMPQPCVDIVVEYDEGILLARRQKEPARGEWFWPGSRLYKGERLDDAPERIAREELGLDVDIEERLGLSEHFWETSAVPGVDQRHTVVIVYRVRPSDPKQAIELDDQHDAYRIVESVDDSYNEYVREYVERFDLL
ncbi:MAG: NUDIX domain-containing protein [Haloarculaceae archaeon]